MLVVDDRFWSSPVVISARALGLLYLSHPMLAVRFRRDVPKLSK
jgi:hypothetical protein